jgi:hypothetical protein
VYKSLENTIQNTQWDCLSTDTQRISNPRTENGSILQGLDDPLEISRVSFSDTHEIREYDDLSEFSVSDSFSPLPPDIFRLSHYYFICDYAPFCYPTSDSFDTECVTSSYFPQSGELTQVQVSTPDTVQVLTKYADDTADIESMFLSARDDSFYQADGSETDPNKFFARPVVWPRILGLLKRPFFHKSLIQ